jgi:hypothetical protein
MERRFDEFLERSFEEPIVRLEREDLKAFIELAALDGVDIIDWHTKGIQAPDVVRGTFQVHPDAASRVFERLLTMRKWYWHDWFPIGIPDPERYLVNFSNVRELRG